MPINAVTQSMFQLKIEIEFDYKKAEIYFKFKK